MRTPLRSVAVVALLVSLLAGCALEPELLPGRPCGSQSDCGTSFSCVRVPGRETSVCVAQADEEPEEPEEVVGCVDAADGAPCGDGNNCTVDDACAGGVCVGVAKDCGDDLCVDGRCEVVGSCNALAATVVAEQALGPKVAYNPLDDELGIAFTAEVLDRTEVFFVRASGAGVPRGVPLQLTDGTPASAEDVSSSSVAADIVFAPEERRFGVLTDDTSGLLSSGTRLHVLTFDGRPAGTTRTVNLLRTGRSAITWTGARFVVVEAVSNTGQEPEPEVLIIDDTDADADGDELFDDELAFGSFFGVDVVSGDVGAEVGVAFINGVDAARDVVFLRADVDGAVLAERLLNPGRPAPAGVAIGQLGGGYVVVWQEGTTADDRVVVGAAVDALGAVTTPARVLTDVGEGAQVPAVVGTNGGAAIVYFANVDGAFAIRTRALSSTLSSSTPITVRSQLPGGFNPTIDSSGADVVVGYGVTTGSDPGDVEAARLCE
jgi:hypothetical protein